MNKKLLMAAVGAAIVAAPMFAHADAATLYGRIHMSVDSQEDGAANNSRTGFVSSNSSRIGVKGGEDLGGGLKAVWQVETTVAPDNTSAATLADRNSFLGLSGGFGTVLAGKYDTPFKNVGVAADLFGDQVGGARAVRSTGGLGWDLRPNNVVAYASPNMSGVTVTVADALGEGTVSHAASASVAYSDGPLYVAFAREVHDIGAKNDETGNRLAATYAFGDSKVTALYQTTSDNGGTAKHDFKVWNVGFAQKMANNTFKVQYANRGEYDDTKDTGATVISLGVDHAMSKNTTTYVTYAKTSNDKSATFSVAGADHGDKVTPAAGKDASGLSVGMVHNF